MELEVEEDTVIAEDNISEDIAKAIEQLETPREDDGKFKAEEPPVETVEAAPEVVQAAPQSWSAAAKAEWANASPVLRAEIDKREKDMHQALTRHDGELRLGREVKDIITPYMAQIQAEGATGPQAIASLLNTAHILRTGSAEQKKALILNTAKQYGVDLGVPESDDYVDPTIAAMQKQMEELRRLADPQAIESRLQDKLERGKVESDIAAFASDPANVHFEAVRPLMVAMLNSNQAKDLKEAYDMACMANPQIRSTLEAAKQAEMEAKRKQDIANKKRAASSITGSPATPSNSKVTNSKTSVEDDLRAAFDELESKI